MPAKRSFDGQLAALEALRHETHEAALKGLRKALGQRNNYLVAKAADLVRDLRLAGLLPELLTAFDRFFADPVKKADGRGSSQAGSRFRSGPAQDLRPATNSTPRRRTPGMTEQTQTMGFVRQLMPPT